MKKQAEPPFRQRPPKKWWPAPKKQAVAKLQPRIAAILKLLPSCYCPPTHLKLTGGKTTSGHPSALKIPAEQLIQKAFCTAGHNLFKKLPCIDTYRYPKVIYKGPSDPAETHKGPFRDPLVCLISPCEGLHSPLKGNRNETNIFLLIFYSFQTF